MTDKGPPQSPFESQADAAGPERDDFVKTAKISSDESGGDSSPKGVRAHAETADDDNETVWQSPMFRRAPFIIVQEFCERLAYYGIATNLVTYLTGVLNMSNSSAAAAVNAWSGTCYVTPLLGAFLADAYLGRYWVILLFSIIYMTGLSGLSASAGVSSLHPAPGQDATSGQLAFFWAFMYLIALGTGGIKPCVSTFGADQFDESRPSHRRLIPRFFNWFYFAINVGAMLSATVIVNVQSHDWFAGFLIPAVAFAIAIIVFVAGSRLYRRMPPAGSPFSRIARVLVGAVAHRKAKIPDDDAALHEAEGPMSVVPGQAKLPRTPGCKCLERAAVATKPPGAPDRWLVTLTEVEEVKAVARLLPIMATLIVYNAVYAQMTTLFILQGEGMNTSLGSLDVAPATVSVLDPISVMIWIPLYDFVIAPFFARRGRPISLTFRIGIGYIIATLAMIAAGVVEVIRLGVVDRHGLQDDDPTAEGAPTVPMSVWWQIPQYFLVGCSEVFAMVGSLELFYSQAPDAMRSTCSALQLIATALGSYLASLLVIIVQAISDDTWVASNVNDGHMDYFFFMMSVLMFLTFIVYIFVAKRFRYKQVVHTTIDPEALALAPDTRGAFSFSAGVIRKMSADLGQGMLRQDSLELHAAMSSGRLSAKHSARASAFLGAASSHFQLQPLAEACECGAAPGAPELQGKADSGGFI